MELQLRPASASMEETSFDVNGKNTGRPTSVFYTDLSRVEGPGLSTGAKVTIGVAAGLAIVAIIILGVEFAHAVYCR
jgi:hypothetical protein